MFYVPNISEQNYLSVDESRHAVKVLRLAVDDEIELLDGKGGYYKATILDANSKHCIFKVVSEEQRISQPYSIHIAISPTKNIDRFEWFIEKCTEIGIDEITPIFTTFSERKIIKLERLEKILISASKQSKRLFFPKLNNAINLSDFLKKSSKIDDLKYVAHCYNQPKYSLFDNYQAGRSATVLIGPEGDFSMEEVSLSMGFGYVPVSISNQRLRTETAGVIACNSLILKNEIQT